MSLTERRRAASTSVQEIPRIFTSGSSARSSDSPAPPRRTSSTWPAMSRRDCEARLDQLSKKKGIHKLIGVIHSKVFPLQNIDAKEVFVQSQLICGRTRRQGGEPITSHAGDTGGGSSWNNWPFGYCVRPVACICASRQLDTVQDAEVDGPNGQRQHKLRRQSARILLEQHGQTTPANTAGDALMTRVAAGGLGLHQREWTNV